MIARPFVAQGAIDNEIVGRWPKISDLAGRTDANKKLTTRDESCSATSVANEALAAHPTMPRRWPCSSHSHISV